MRRMSRRAVYGRVGTVGKKGGKTVGPARPSASEMTEGAELRKRRSQERSAKCEQR